MVANFTAPVFSRIRLKKFFTSGGANCHLRFGFIPASKYPASTTRIVGSLSQCDCIAPLQGVTSSRSPSRSVKMSDFSARFRSGPSWGKNCFTRLAPREVHQARPGRQTSPRPVPKSTFQSFRDERAAGQAGDRHSPVFPHLAAVNTYFQWAKFSELHTHTNITKCYAQCLRII